MKDLELPRVPQRLEPVVEALDPALDRLVIVGGWAHRLHRFHPLAAQLRDDPLTTKDCDLAIPLEALAMSWPPLGERLARSGFILKQGGGELGESRVYVDPQDPTFTIQFLAVRRGQGKSRDGSIVRTVQIGGISAEVLRDMDLTAAAPWNLSCRRADDGLVNLAVAHPAAFVVGKLLVSCAPNRGPTERAKDLVYVAETIRLFLDRLEELRDEARELHDRMGANRRRRLSDVLRYHFLERSNELRRAVDQTRELAGGRPGSMTDFVSLCEHGIARILGQIIRWPN
jgi:hypothetical protein